MSRPRLPALVALGVALALAAGVTGFAVTRAPAADVRASSTAAGSDPAALLRAAPDSAERPATWRSDGETVGAWLRVGWSKPTEIDRIRFSTAERAPFASALVTFGDGSSVLVTADDTGSVDVAIPSRSVRSATVTVSAAPSDATSVGLAGLRLDDSGSLAAVVGGAAVGAAEPSTSTAADGTGAGDLVDGDLGDGEAGSVWRAADDDTDAWAQLAWAEPVELAAVQLLGSPSAADEPLWGELVFDDGSRVAVTGVATGPSAGTPTTVAFAPRMSRNVRAELHTASGRGVALAEFAAVAAGTTPARAPRDDGAAPAGSGLSSASASAAAGACDLDTPAAGTAAADALSLVCPGVGSLVGEGARLVIAGPAGASYSASAWLPHGGSGSGDVDTIGTGALGDGSDGAPGRAAIELPLARMQAGPTAVRVDLLGPDGAPTGIPLYAQLVNGEGIEVTGDGTAPSGMTLQWDEEFTAPLSVSHWGDGADYGATKPAWWGGSEFGEAVFADPAWNRGTLTTLDDEYLRIRSEPISGQADPYRWDRAHLSGLLSSLHVGGSGFSAQYGYFEARMLAPAGTGTWPAFWMLDSESTTQRSPLQSEVDAAELYGHDTAGSCHSLHDWVGGENESEVECLPANGVDDWALAWHDYGVRITPDGADYYLDGELVASHRGLGNHAVPFFFMLDLSLGGGWPIDLSATGDTADLYVDWVRVST